MYRCNNAPCGRGFPRKVNFCPYCGTRQQGATVPPLPQRAAAEPVRPVTEAPRGAPAQSAPSEAPRTAYEPVQPAATAAPQYTPEAPRTANEPQSAASAAALERLAAAVALGKKPAAPPPPISPYASSGHAAPPHAPAGSGSGAPPGTGAGTGTGTPGAGPASPSPSRPPLRAPISKTTWAIVVLVLAAVWIVARPGRPEKKFDARVEHAVALTTECKLDLARAELASLKTDKATAAQIKQVQDAIGGTAAGCEKKRQRGKAWSELRSALESALQGGAVDRAASRLAAFTKKWGEDDDTRDWDKRIDLQKGERLLDEADACLRKADRACLENKLLAAERLQRQELTARIGLLRESLSRLLEATVLEQKTPAQPPVLTNEPPRQAVQRPASPVISTAPQVQQTVQQARKILADAERELSQGNYKGAMDKADICATMIDVGNRECLGLKQRAERLNREMLRCVASGADWVNDRCQ
ncbi:MAG: hypothetical protein V4724_23705 [Pseudomonadota bacterium]